MSTQTTRRKASKPPKATVAKATPKTKRPRTTPPKKATVAPTRTRHRRLAAAAAQAAPPAPAHPTGLSKQARLIALLRSPAGGTIAQMSALTGWQPHTVRGTLSGVLRKRLQLNVVLDPATRIYRIVEATS